MYEYKELKEAKDKMAILLYLFELIQRALSKIADNTDLSTEIKTAEKIEEGFFGIDSTLHQICEKLSNISSKVSDISERLEKLDDTNSDISRYIDHVDDSVSELNDTISKMSKEPSP